MATSVYERVVLQYFFVFNDFIRIFKPPSNGQRLTSRSQVMEFAVKKYRLCWRWKIWNYAKPASASVLMHFQVVIMVQMLQAQWDWAVAVYKGLTALVISIVSGPSVCFSFPMGARAIRESVAYPRVRWRGGKIQLFLGGSPRATSQILRCSPFCCFFCRDSVCLFEIICCVRSFSGLIWNGPPCLFAAHEPEVCFGVGPT